MCSASGSLASSSLPPAECALTLSRLVCLLRRSSRPRLRAPVRPLVVSRFGVARPYPVRVCPQAPSSLGGRHSRRRAGVASAAVLPLVAVRQTSRPPQRGRPPGSLPPCRRRRSSQSGVRSGLRPQRAYLSATAHKSSEGTRSRRCLRWFGRVVTAVPRPSLFWFLSVPRCRAFYYFCCGMFAPDGALGAGLSRQPPLGGLRPFFKSPPAPFATLGRCPAPTVRPRRARASFGRAPLSSGAPLLRTEKSAPDGASPSLRSGLRVQQVARWITFSTFGVFMTKHSVTMFRSRPP